VRRGLLALADRERLDTGPHLGGCDPLPPFARAAFQRAAHSAPAATGPPSAAPTQNPHHEPSYVDCSRAHRALHRLCVESVQGFLAVNAAECRERAEECRRNAETATRQRDRQDWLRLADEWTKMAEEYEGSPPKGP
jgi:hypothetical protein